MHEVEINVRETRRAIEKRQITDVQLTLSTGRTKQKHRQLRKMSNTEPTRGDPRCSRGV